MPSANAPGAPAQHLLTYSDYKILSLSALGKALEFYDFIIFVFPATVVGKLFFPANMPEWLRQLQTFGLLVAGYLVQPLGGVIMAHFSDLLRRKCVSTLSIFMMAAPTLIMGLLSTYTQIGIWAPLVLLLLGVIQGATIGGEVPGAWVFVAGRVPARHVGYTCGTLTSGLTVGILLGSLVAIAINSFYNAIEAQGCAWQIPFPFGEMFGLFSVYLCRWLHGTPVFAELQRRKALAEEMPLKAVVRDHRDAVLVLMLLTWVLSAVIVMVILMTPTVLQSVYGFNAATALEANSLTIICLTLGCIVAGRMADRFDAGLTLVASSVLLALVSWSFYGNLRAHPDWLFPLYALTGFFVGIVDATPYVIVNAFPPVVHFSSLSFSYNLAYAIFGGLTPIAVALLLKQGPMGPAYYVVALCLVGFLVGLYLLAQKKPAGEAVSMG